MSAAERPPIVFLDIDGILLSTSTWDLPANVRLLREKSAKQMSIWEFGERASFDPVAVMLVNRLCHRTGARIVLSTSWRKSFGIPETRAKLVAEGIEDNLFHADYACPITQWPKEIDIGGWLHLHPEVTRSLTIDDDRIEGVEQVTTDRVCGFGVREYRLACSRLGGEDWGYGVVPVAPDDKARVLEVRWTPSVGQESG